CAGSPAFGGESDERGEPAGAAAEPADASPVAADGNDEGGAKRGRKKRGKARRGHGAKFAGRVVMENQLRDEPLPRPSGNLEIVSLANPGERAKVNIYNKDGSYSVDALEDLNGVLRCRRTDDEKPI